MSLFSGRLISAIDRDTFLLPPPLNDGTFAVRFPQAPATGADGFSGVYACRVSFPLYNCGTTLSDPLNNSEQQWK